MMILLNVLLLLIPVSLLIFFLEKGKRRSFLPFVLLYIFTSAFLSFMIHYLFGIRVSYISLWSDYYLASLACAFLVRYLWKRMYFEEEKNPISKFDLILLSFASLMVLIAFGCWYYIGSSTSAMYYIWLDACRFLKSTGLVFPPLPPGDFMASYLSPMVLNPAPVPLLELLTAGLPQGLFIHGWGVLVGFCYVALMLTMSEISSLLFKNRAIGVMAYAFFFLKDWGGLNWLKVNLEVGSHQAPFFYGAALLLLCWVLIWKRKNMIFTGLFIWTAMAFVAMRPYLAAFAGALALSILFIFIKSERKDILRKAFRKEFLVPVSAAIVLGLVIFSWQLWLFARYGSLVSYSHSEGIAALSSYGIALPGRDLASRLATFWTNFCHYFPYQINKLLSLKKAVLGYTFLPLPVFFLFIASLFGWGLRRALRKRDGRQPWLVHLGIISLGFLMLSLAINVDHWKTMVAWVIVFYLIAAAALFYIIGDRRAIHGLTRIIAAIVLVAITVPPLIQEPWPQIGKLGEDPFRRNLAQFISEKGGSVMLTRIEPGADAYYDVPGKYFWDFRFPWNDVDKIMMRLQWDADEIAREFRKEGIRWIYKTLSWDLVNYAGRETMKNMKDMLEKRKDLFVPVLQREDWPDNVVFEVVLPGEHPSSVPREPPKAAPPIFKWIYHRRSWDTVNYAGRDTMKNMLEKRKDLFVPVLQREGRPDDVVFEVPLPVELPSPSIFKWIYRRLSWDTVNYAGRDAMKNMLEKRKDLFVPVLQREGRPDDVVFEVVLPGEHISPPIFKVLYSFGQPEGQLIGQERVTFIVPVLIAGFSAAVSTPFQVEIEGRDGAVSVQEFSKPASVYPIKQNGPIKSMRLIGNPSASFTDIYHIAKKTQSFHTSAFIVTAGAPPRELPAEQIALSLDPYLYPQTVTWATYRLEPGQSILFQMMPPDKTSEPVTCVDIYISVSVTGWTWDHIKIDFIDEAQKVILPSGVYPSLKDVIVRYIFADPLREVRIKFTNPDKKALELYLRDIALY